MARVANDGLHFFPFNVYFFSEKDIKVIRSRFGSNGIMIYLYLLCEIYKKGYYFQLDNDNLIIMADDLKLKENLINQVINFLIQRMIFDKKIWETYRVLTSIEIQKQYMYSKKHSVKRKIIVDRQLWLIQDVETESFIQLNSN